jgi:molybdenum-dependent DNA-binding transcriptional regulator ModE
MVLDQLLPEHLRVRVVASPRGGPGGGGSVLNGNAAGMASRSIP